MKKCEIWTKFEKLVQIVKFGQNCDVWWMNCVHEDKSQSVSLKPNHSLNLKIWCARPKIKYFKWKLLWNNFPRMLTFNLRVTWGSRCNKTFNCFPSAAKVKAIAISRGGGVGGGLDNELKTLWAYCFLECAFNELKTMYFVGKYSYHTREGQIELEKQKQISCEQGERQQR